MSTTFEEKYRKKTPGDAAPAAATPAIEVLKAAAKEEYKACNTSAHPELELWVRTSAANPNAETSIPYSYRNHMITDGSGFVISMHFSTPVISVTLQGRNLGELWRKLLRHEVEWVQEFDPRKWAVPGDGEPCITGIQIARKPLPETDDGRLPGEKKESGKPSTH
jgi:hypothetical protein